MISFIGENTHVFEQNFNLKREVSYVVAVLAKAYPSCVSWHRQDETGYDHRNGEVLYIELPDVGQVSWHIEDDDCHLFKDIERVNKSPWDGHDSEEKWKRISRFIHKPGGKLVGRDN